MVMVKGEKNINIKSIFHIISICFGVILILYSIVISFITNLNVGIFILFFLGVLMCFLLPLVKRISKLKYRWLVNTIKYAAIVIIIGVSVVLCIIIFAGKRDTTNFHEQAVIVLGSGIKGKEVTPMLQNRLDKANHYLEKNPKAIIVVSGGQGPQEEISEALAMKNYLVKKGIPPNKIIMEDRATSTYENFIFSKKILDKKIKGNYTITYITNSFHIYRAGKIASETKINSTSYSAETECYLIPTVYSREVIAVIKGTIIGY